MINQNIVRELYVPSGSSLKHGRHRACIYTARSYLFPGMRGSGEDRSVSRPFLTILARFTGWIAG